MSASNKRKAILAAAVELFGRHGYNVSMDAVSQLAAVSKQTVYHHFKSKEALFQSCIKESYLEQQDVSFELDPNVSVHNALCGFGNQIQLSLSRPQNRNSYRNAISQIDHHPEFAAAYLELITETLLSQLTHYLTVKSKEGFIRLLPSVDEAALQLLSMFYGKAVYWSFLGQEVEQSEQEIKRYIQSCVELFLGHERLSERPHV